MYRTILLVDDSRVSRMMTRKTVGAILPDATIIEAANGQEALEKLASEDIDAAVLDFHMPGMTGLELAEKIKAQQPKLPVTLLTANIQNETKERAAALGAGYLTKPVKKRRT